MNRQLFIRLASSHTPPRKMLIADTISMSDRLPLIKYIFSDRDEVGVFEYLSTEGSRLC